MSGIRSPDFFDVVLFLLSSLVTGPNFMSISSLVLELWQFYFIRDWPEIRKSERPTSGFCPISGDGSESWIANLAQMFLREYYWMLQHVRGYSFYRFWVIKGKPTGGGELIPPTSPRLGLIRTILLYIEGLMIWVLREQLVRLPDLLQNLHFH